MNKADSKSKYEVVLLADLGEGNLEMVDFFTVDHPDLDGETVLVCQKAVQQLRSLAGEKANKFAFLATLMNNPQKGRSRFVVREPNQIRRMTDYAEPAAKPEGAEQVKKGLRVPPEFAEVVERLWGLVGKLAVVSPEDETTIREAVNALPLRVLNAEDRELAESLVQQARAAMIARKREVGVQVLLDLVAKMGDDVELAMLDVACPVVSIEGVSYPLMSLVPVAATGTDDG